MTAPTVTYTTIFSANTLVTGIRQAAGEGRPVLITGTQAAADGSALHALLYLGPLEPMDPTGDISLQPTFPGQTVTTAVFYGPNTALFNPEMGPGNLRAVGTYTYSDGGAAQHGMMYQGPVDGSGTWTAIDVPDEVAGGTVANTVPHSTMGDLVVGNYDLVGALASSANAFIFDTRSGRYSALAIGKLTTAYGIWQNGGSGSSSYTIAGGSGTGTGLNQGFLLDYDASTGAVTNLTFFPFGDGRGLGTHFEAISGVPGGYSMAATTNAGAAFAFIPRSADGSFGGARWTEIANPESAGLCTANSVVDNNLIGIYHPAGGGIRSYLAVVSPDPFAAAS
jgi:hypothetical protein